MENWSNGLEALRTSVFGGYRANQTAERCAGRGKGRPGG